MIKAVITAIPTYIMSIFNLPKMWCSEVNALIADFWWGTNADRRREHWKRWDTLTLAKPIGGLGFRELQTFNKALLTKMAARVMEEPSTLWVRIIKSLYFPNCEFLEAGK